MEDFFLGGGWGDGEDLRDATCTAYIHAHLPKRSRGEAHRIV